MPVLPARRQWYKWYISGTPGLSGTACAGLCPPVECAFARVWRRFVESAVQAAQGSGVDFLSMREVTRWRW